MTSNTECYVYITLPRQTDFVTAGKFNLENDRRGTPIGRFVYGRNYLAREDAVPIDPIELKLDGKTDENRLLNGVFGALRDASPDYWGRRVIEKHAGVAELEELDYLLHSPDDRAGALGFGLGQEPPAPRRQFNRTMDLERLQANADAIIEDEDLLDGRDAQQIYELLGGTSMGGARPKTLIEDNDGLWIAKFNRADDRWNHARIEHAMLVLARACGIRTAESRVLATSRHLLCPTGCPISIPVSSWTSAPKQWPAGRTGSDDCHATGDSTFGSLASGAGRTDPLMSKVPAPSESFGRPFEYE